MKKYAVALFAVVALTLSAVIAWGANPTDFGGVLGASRVNGLPSIRVPIVISTGNTFQTILPLNAGRRSLTIQNNNASDSCWIDYGVSTTGTVVTAGNAAKAGAWLLLPGGSLSRYFPYDPSDEIEGTCTTTGDTMRVEYQ